MEDGESNVVSGSKGGGHGGSDGTEGKNDTPMRSNNNRVQAG